MSSRIILVTGGARSGKSSFAEQKLAAVAGRHAYIATAEVYDTEMAERVRLHQDRRPAEWRTYEVPRRLRQRLPQILQAADGALVDCLTVYVATFLYDRQELTDAAVTAQAVAEIRSLCQDIRASAGRTVVFVTDEVGCGIVPMEHVSRLYRDVIGTVNQYMAQEADEVYWVVCGIPVCIKGPDCALSGGAR